MNDGVERIASPELILEDFAAAARWRQRQQTTPHEDDFVVFRHRAGPDA